MCLHPRLKRQSTSTLMLTTRISSSLICQLHDRSMALVRKCFLLLSSVKSKRLLGFSSSSKGKTKGWLRNNVGCKLFKTMSEIGLRLKCNLLLITTSNLLQTRPKDQTMCQTCRHLKLLKVLSSLKELRMKMRRSQWWTTCPNSAWLATTAPRNELKEVAASKDSKQPVSILSAMKTTEEKTCLKLTYSD